MRNLQRLRHLAELSQRELATKAHMSLFRLSLAESNLIPLRDDELRSLRNVLRPALVGVADVIRQFEAENLVPEESPG